MSAVQNGYRGLSLLMQINADRFMFIGALVVALALGSLVQSF